MNVVCEHISANCNPMTNVIGFIHPEVIAYCFKNQVGIYSLAENRVFMNLNFNQINAGRSNCLKLINLDQQTGLVNLCVGYDTGHIIIYQFSVQITNTPTFKVKQVIQQKCSIISIHFSSNHLITNNNNGFVMEYQFNGQQFELKSTLEFALNKLIETVQSLVRQDTITLFLGGVDQKIHVFTRKITDSDYIYAFRLDGHENAITKLSLIQQRPNQYLLASSSKDGYIRIWRMTTDLNLTKFHKNVKFLNLGQLKLSVFLESVLMGHECSVTSVCWARFRKIELVSCSLDSTICIWGKDEQNNIWNVENRMGQFIGNKNAYFQIITNTQNKLSDNPYLVGVNYIGSALIWNYSKQRDGFDLRPSFTGHSNKVNDIDWDHTGNFVVTVSNDQTTRVISQNQNTKQFSEISRAQIHGYDINSVAAIKVKDNVIDLIACGADQKVIRILEPPACFANYLNTYTHQNLHLFFNNFEEEKKYLKSKEGDSLLYDTYSQGGVQVLGLMTKVQRVQRQSITNYYDEDQDPINNEDQELPTHHQVNIDYNIPPNDDYLIKHTLWPQMNKLYGHPHEIECLAHTKDSKYLASSCQALNKQAACILIWDTKSWKIVKTIEHHTYTVYDMAYSENGEYFASVSKDRRLGVFAVKEDYKLIWSDQAHTRAITCVSMDKNSSMIATGSRDKYIKCHSISHKKVVSEINVESSVYCLSFGINNLIACGCENGEIKLLSYTEGGMMSIIYTIPQSIGHTCLVKRIKWKSYQDQQFASCGDDHSVRIFKILHKS